MSIKCVFHYSKYLRIREDNIQLNESGNIGLSIKHCTVHFKLTMKILKQITLHLTLNV